MQKITSYVLVVIAILVGVVAFKPAAPATVTVPTGSVDMNYLTGTTPATSTVTTAGQQVLAEKSGRRYFALYHDDLTTTAYCTLNSTSTAIVSSGITLASTTKNYWSSGEEQVLYEGAVFCKASATTTIRTIEQ